jgi:integrase
MRRRNGEGSIYKRTDGKHEAAISTPTGRRYFRRKNGESFDDFRARIEAAKKETKRGTAATGSLEEMLRQWLASVERSLRPKTLLSYRETVDSYIVPTIGMVPVTKLTAEHVQQAMRYAESMGRAPRTVAYVRAVLRRGLHVAMKWEMTDRNVAALVDAPRVERREHTMPTELEWRSFLGSVDGHDYEALLLILALLGPRRGEVLGLQWPDVQHDAITFTASLSRVKGKGLVLSPPKTSTSRRTVPLSPMIHEALIRWRVRQLEWKLKAGADWQDSEFVWTDGIGRPISPERLRKMVKGRRIHDFRHIAASHMLAEGVPLEVVSTILGHSSIRVTKDVYGHIMPRQFTDAAERIQRIGTRKA